MKIGIFFGGPAREREISFAGGKTAMENIDKSLFEPVPVFVDGCGNFILLKPELVYAPSIRDFYPPKSYQGDYQIYSESLGQLSDDELETMISSVGVRITPDKFAEHFKFAFIAMHGPACEDGSIQGLLEWYGMPYSGPSLMGSSIGIDKIAQNDLIKLAIGLDKKTTTLTRAYFEKNEASAVFEEIKAKVGLPFVVKAPHQGSSIGVAFVKKDSVEDFEKAVKQCLFIREVSENEWNSADKHEFVQRMANLDEGIGLPVSLNGEVVYHPQELLEKLNNIFDGTTKTSSLISMNSEDAVLIEGFVKGQEFSCGVIQTPDCESVALPPTEIIAAVEVFDFKAKYQSSATRKKIPVDTALENNQQIQHDVKATFDALKFGVCTRIDGFLTPDGRVILHDPNTIPGMSPTSLIFKQMAEIGMNVTDAITYFIRQSIRERIRVGKNTFKFQQLLDKLDLAIAQRVAELPKRKKVAVIFGGYSAENQEESYVKARKAFGKLAASSEYLPIPVFVTEDGKYHQLPINLMFKEFAEDIMKLLDGTVHPLIVSTRKKAEPITLHFTGKLLESVKIIDTLTGFDFGVSCGEDLVVDLPALAF
ncbi:D-alanine-D-alanine ligase [Arcicella aurantiaca]|uniref:D-alanine--D-alanine ligase n=1 Tax=Arcicella aurantiaca TaxID=591202 RepID=A0A316EE82_9BACT|nr:D-alanine--D-alanine ligase [Arcicella aurantiaca]PWK27916.1 D-alanine-D-alanine ligase [Arcicella aurantiaca]